MGLTFRTENVDSLAVALREFAGKPESWFAEIAEHSRRLLEDESWEKVGQLYRELLETMWAREGKSP